MESEKHILMALFKATVEQSTALTGHLKQKPKQEFNLWQKQGFKLLEEMEKHNMLNSEYLNNISDIYNNINLEIRKDYDTRRKKTTISPIGMDAIRQ